MERIRTLIVDDEPAARAGIRELLADDAEVVVAGECSNGREAVAAIQQAPPDLLFLDVQMPELDGFGVLREVGTDGVPSVVFVTAYDQYALRAFEVHALDYLLKPFSDDRFRESLARAKAQVRHGRLGQLSHKLAALLDTYGATPLPASGAVTPTPTPTPIAPAPAPQRAYLERLVVKSGGKVTLLRVGEIEWIDADGDYARIHVGKAWHLLRETMKRLEQQLDPARFVRIHRSTIVNLEKVKELQPFFRGEYVAVLQNGVTLKLSRGYRANLEARLGRAI